MAAVKPVILLAFANDPADGINYLRNLPAEERRIRAALETAAAQGLCDFEVRYNATLDDILAAFQQPKLRGRIAIFHYGGHADSYELLLQSGPGNLQRVDGRGFAAFLAEQRGLQLVFLNACTTEPQVEGLLAADVPVVIATTQEVDDDAAAELAARFYAELARGASIGAAYRQATAALRAAKGDDPALFYTPGGGPPPGPQTSSSAPPVPPSVEAGGAASGGLWPWLLRTRRGAEGAVEWSLPQAAGDPLFGLPPLPPRPLPPSPYQRALDYYTRDLAELFFGRGRQIRDLYQRVTAPGHSSVLLYYGQSGVGKSSLLDAGLAPRLEPTHAVLYARRDRTVGLLGTLQKQLAALGAQTSSSAPPAEQTGTSALQGKEQTRTSAVRETSALLSAWLGAEAQLGKPLILILDQVEEVFSRRNPDLPQELAEFAAALGEIDGGRQPRPAGALLLGFRKERLAEIEAALRSTRVDFAKLFLEPLDEEGIEEILWGPVRSERLRARYNLGVEDDLPAAVAHDLSADPDSPVAPTLNILLRKLWAAATAEAASAPRFTLALYEHLRREGILLDDFLRQQTATLAQEQPDAVASGLLLDLWAFHTTALGTSDQRDAAEVKAAYSQPSIEALIGRSKELYVLADPPGDRATDGGGTRLAHDTLAPLVRRDFGTSTLPGQQARRLLESRAVDWESGRAGPLLDDAALGVIDRGLAGMRTLSEAEGRLLAASREAQAQRARSRRLWRAGALAVALVVLALLVATFLISENGRLQSERADREAAERVAAEAGREAADERARRQAAEREAAEERSSAAQLSTQLANQRREAAAREAQTNESRRLAALAQQQLASDPVTSLHLALAALPTGADAPSVPEAEYALRQAVLTSRERRYVTATIDLPDQVALRGERLAVGGPAPAVYDLELTPQPFAFPPAFTDIVGLRWGADMRLLGWNREAVWVVGGGAPQQFPLPLADDQVRCAEWQPAQRWVAICTFNNLYAWQPSSGRVVTITTDLDTLALTTEPRSAIWSPDGRWLAGLGAKLVLWDSNAPATPAQIFYKPEEPGQWVAHAAWLPDERSLVATWTAPFGGAAPLHIWRAGAGELETVALPPELASRMDVQMIDAPDVDTGAARLLAWSVDGLLGLYTVDGSELARAGDVPLYLWPPVLSPDGEHVAGFAPDGTALVWSLPDLQVTARLDRTNRFVAGPLTGAAWLDNNTLVLGDNNGLLQVAALDDATGSIAITRLAGNRPGERLGKALRLADGRLLTAGLLDSPTGASLRIWQLDPAPAAQGGALPAASQPLCLRLHRSLSLPPDLPVGIVYDWQPDGVLLLGGAEQVARWTVGGAAQVLPPDDNLHYYALSPDRVQVLRYGNDTDGEIWRWDPDGWRQVETLAGPIAGAHWSPHGLLVGYADGAAALVDPTSGGAHPLPPGTRAGNSTMLAPDLLLAASPGAVTLYDLAEERTLASWDAPGETLLSLDAASPDGSTFVWSSPAFGELYVLGVDTAQGTLTEFWRSSSAALNRPPSALHPTQPLLATVENGNLVLVNLAQGKALWQSASIATVAQQSFLRVQWSTDGLYLITQAEPVSPDTFAITIGVWRWDVKQQRLVLMQEAPSEALLAVSPDAQMLLALPPGRPFPQELWIYPIFADAAHLHEEVQTSCLLTRAPGDAQRQAFGLQGR